MSDNDFYAPSFFGGDPLIVGFVAVLISLLVLFCLFRCRRIRSSYHDPFPTQYPSSSQPSSRPRANEDLQYIHVMSPLRSNRVQNLRSQTQASEPLPKYEAPPPGYEDVIRGDVDLADIRVAHDEVQEGMSTHQTIPENTIPNTTSDSTRREGEDLSREYEV